MLTGVNDPEAACRVLAGLYPGALIVVKLDADGALVGGAGGVHHVPPHSNKLVDATGAGDSFAGAFLSRFLLGADPVEAAEFAVRVAEWVIEHPGARPKPGPALARILGH